MGRGRDHCIDPKRRKIHRIMRRQGRSSWLERITVSKPTTKKITEVPKVSRSWLDRLISKIKGV